MNFDRIKNVLDIDVLLTKTVTVFGTGGSTGLILDLVRSGVLNWRIVDPDVVGVENIARQGHVPADVGKLKVEAVADMIRSIAPIAEIDVVPIDCTGLNDSAAREMFRHTDLFYATTDSFKCQAFVNRLALLVNAPAIFVGIYPGGMGAEVVWIDPRFELPCMRCICSRRFEMQQAAADRGQKADPASDGADIFSVRFPDAIAGQIGLGLLTRGADNRYGRLIEKLARRQFIQVAMSPEFELNGRDIVREKLRIDPNEESYFTWNSIALPDPDRGQLPCPDCEQIRGHRFEKENGSWRRITSQKHEIASTLDEQTDF